MSKKKFVVTVPLTREQWFTLINVADKRGLSVFELIEDFADSLNAKEEDKDIYVVNAIRSITLAETYEVLASNEGEAIELVEDGDPSVIEIRSSSKDGSLYILDAKAK